VVRKGKNSLPSADIFAEKIVYIGWLNSGLNLSGAYDIWSLIEVSTLRFIRILGIYFLNVEFLR